MNKIANIIDARIAKALRQNAGYKRDQKLKDILAREIVLALQPYIGKRIDDAVISQVTDIVDMTISDFFSKLDS